MHAPAVQRQEFLIGLNISWLRQAEALLNRISDGVYTASPSGPAPHRAGGHIRHILEFYECLLGGLAGGRVDYDARRRDLLVETSRPAAQARIRSLIHRLETEPALRIDSLVSVRIEDSPFQCFRRITDDIFREDCFQEIIQRLLRKGTLCVMSEGLAPGLDVLFFRQ